MIVYTYIYTFDLYVLHILHYMYITYYSLYIGQIQYKAYLSIKSPFAMRANASFSFGASGTRDLVAVYECMNISRGLVYDN